MTPAMMFSGANSTRHDRERMAANRSRKATGTTKNGLNASVMPVPNTSDQNGPERQRFAVAAQRVKRRARAAK